MFRTRAVAAIALVGAVIPLAVASSASAGSDEPPGCTADHVAALTPPVNPDAVATTTEPSAAVVPDEAADPLAGAWCVVSIGALAVGDVVATVEFNGAGEVFGLGGVNRFRGIYAIGADGVEFGPIVQTAMAGPEPAMAVEAALLGALRDTQPFDVDGALLTIGAGDDAVVLQAVDQASADPVPAGAAVVVSGTVTYLQRIALVEGATVIVRVSDVSIADIAAPVVAEVVITPMTQVPIPYAIAVPVTLLDAGRQYSLSVRIVHGDDLLFVSTESLPVDSGVAEQTIDVVLSPA